MKKKDKRIKRIAYCVAVFAVMLSLFTIQTVFASEITVHEENISYTIDGEVKVFFSGVCGDVNEIPLVVVLNPGHELENVENSDMKAVQYQDYVECDSDGAFEMKFGIYGDVYGEFQMYCGIYGEEPQYISSYVRMNGTEMQSFMEDELLISKDSLADVLQDGNVVFALNSFEPFGAVDKVKLAERVYPVLATLDDVSEEYTVFEKFNDVRELLKQYSVLEVFNQNSNIVVCDEKWNFVYEDVVGLTTNDEVNNTSFVENFEKTVSLQGKQKIINSLYGKNVDTVSEFVKLFAENTVIYGIKYPALNGYGHIEKLLDIKNRKFIGIDFDKALTTDCERALAEHKELFADADEIETFIKSNNTSKPSSPSSSGGSGGSGGGNSYAIAPGFAEVNVSTNIFVDLVDSHWAAQAVAFLKSKGVINGTEEGKFLPDNYVTREEMCKMLCIAAENELVHLEDTEKVFGDIDDSAWYSPYVYTLFANKSVRGISEDKFGTGMNISRQDLCVLVHRIFFNESGTGAADTVFTDFENVADYAKTAVLCLAENDIIGGYGDGTFRPYDMCTRAEAAKIIYTAMKGGI